MVNFFDQHDHVVKLEEKSTAKIGNNDNSVAKIGRFPDFSYSYYVKGF